MFLVSSKEMLKKAQREYYAIPSFNIYNLEMIQVITETASEMRSPVIISVLPSTIKYIGLEFLIAICQQAAHKHALPLALHFEQQQSYQDAIYYIQKGIRSISLTIPQATYQKHVDKLQEVVKLSRDYEANIEVEISLNNALLKKKSLHEDQSSLDKPSPLDTEKLNIKIINQLANQIDIDAISIPIGEHQGLHQFKPTLNFITLRKLQSQITQPLVLSSISNYPDSMIRKAISLGICKINIQEELSIAFSDGIKRHFMEHPNSKDPRFYLVPAKSVMKRVVIDKINLCQSAGRI
ncbi:class II fructose-bisphosphate aldolase [Vibrio sp. SS-MA-C1-2]|uniref:class II fructose-bisphosphate aldolase n=1 Tax=Vibrio sp. SS-MA-C1-2 TaxID=2908646 RepID=UPI001F46E13B|nr:class II fructose-bisphosphate aldolase [Vibrio sp. SS-MA-C1-2]UJF19739.1 class II fructose-bisphosphate aldolase [Vibrio sp. SS-MA-C1-2]